MGALLHLGGSSHPESSAGRREEGAQKAVPGLPAPASKAQQGPSRLRSQKLFFTARRST